MVIIRFDYKTFVKKLKIYFGLRQTFAHELGHALNMPHDFFGPYPGSCRADKSGSNCCEKGTVMDYRQVIMNFRK